MSKYRYIQDISFKLKFGVNLKDLYPCWYLHPALKMLIYNCTKAPISFPLEVELRRSNYTEKWNLERRLLAGLEYEDLIIPLGSYLWTLKSFLEQLPVPLFVAKTENIKKCHWKNLAVQCFDWIHKHKEDSISDELKEALACSIYNLPPNHVVLLLELFELLNVTSRRYSKKDSIDRTSVLALAKYFSGSLFMRPLPANDYAAKPYVPLVTFLIFYWSDVNWRIQALMDAICINEISHFRFIRRKMLPIYSENYKLDNRTQTVQTHEKFCDKEEHLDEDFEKSLIKLLNLEVSTQTNLSKKGIQPTETKNNNKTDFVENVDVQPPKYKLREIYSRQDFSQCVNLQNCNDVAFSQNVNLDVEYINKLMNTNEICQWQIPEKEMAHFCQTVNMSDFNKDFSQNIDTLDKNMADEFILNYNKGGSRIINDEDVGKSLRNDRDSSTETKLEYPTSDPHKRYEDKPQTIVFHIKHSYRSKKYKRSRKIKKQKLIFETSPRQNVEHNCDCIQPKNSDDNAKAIDLNNCNDHFQTPGSCTNGCNLNSLQQIRGCHNFCNCLQNKVSYDVIRQFDPLLSEESTNEIFTSDFKFNVEKSLKNNIFEVSFTNSEINNNENLEIDLVNKSRGVFYSIKKAGSKFIERVTPKKLKKSQSYECLIQKKCCRVVNKSLSV